MTIIFLNILKLKSYVCVYHFPLQKFCTVQYIFCLQEENFSSQEKNIFMNLYMNID